MCKLISRNRWHLSFLHLVSTYNRNNWALGIENQKQLILAKLTTQAQANCGDLSWNGFNNQISQIVNKEGGSAHSGTINKNILTSMYDIYGSRGYWFLYNTQPSYSSGAAYRLSGNYTIGGASNPVMSTIAYLLFRNYPPTYKNTITVNWDGLGKRLNDLSRMYRNRTPEQLLLWILREDVVTSTSPFSIFIFKNPYEWATSNSSSTMPYHMKKYTTQYYSVAIYIM